VGNLEEEKHDHNVEVNVHGIPHGAEMEP
jgi:hypothetical protein